VTVSDYELSNRQGAKNAKEITKTNWAVRRLIFIFLAGNLRDLGVMAVQL
jgi:hypothetical protein